MWQQIDVAIVTKRVRLNSTNRLLYETGRQGIFAEN
jgi:hypothetical protein